MAEEKKKGGYWFSLENGTHVHVGEGETPKQATERTIGKPIGNKSSSEAFDDDYEEEFNNYEKSTKKEAIDNWENDFSNEEVKQMKNDYKGKENDIKKIKDAGFTVDDNYKAGNTFKLEGKNYGEDASISLGQDGKYYRVESSGGVFYYDDIDTAIDRARYISGKSPYDGALSDKEVEDLRNGTSNNKKIDYDKIEKGLPANMRWKETSVASDGTLYWVTQRSFNDEDLETAKEVLRDNGIDKAYFVSRDDSPSYDYQDDLDEGVGVMVDVKNDSIYTPEKNPNSARTSFHNEIEKLKGLDEWYGIPNNPYYSPYGSEDYVFEGKNGFIGRGKDGKYRASNYQKGATEIGLNSLEEAINTYKNGARTKTSADNLYNRYGANIDQKEYNDFISGRITEDELTNKLRGNYESDLLNKGFEKISKNNNVYYRPKNFNYNVGDTYTEKEWSYRGDKEPMRTTNYKVVNSPEKNMELLNYNGSFSEDYLPFGNVSKEGWGNTVDKNNLNLVYVGKQNANFLKQVSSRYGFSNPQTTKSRMNRYKNENVRALGQKALDLYNKIYNNEIRK